MTNNAETMKGVETGNGETSTIGQEDANQWILYVDGTSNENGFRVGIMLISLEGHKVHCALCFGFSVSNNEDEYEALIVGLRLAIELQTHNLKIYNNSQLVLNQMNDIYSEKGERMTVYLEKAKGLMKRIPTTSIEVIPRSKNANATLWPS